MMCEKYGSMRLAKIMFQVVNRKVTSQIFLVSVVIRVAHQDLARILNQMVLITTTFNHQTTQIHFQLKVHG